MTVFYNIFLFFFNAGIHLASLWDPKAKKWLLGRKEGFHKIRSSIGDRGQGIIWFHCSSLGEFEQGRPVLEAMKAQDTRHKIVLTFFSPSGFEACKDYKGADHIFYLPLDSKKKARRFVDIINPDLVVFVKYDLWYYYLREIKNRNINNLLISAVFRKDQPFFKWYGSLYRKMLSSFTRIFVQNEESLQLLNEIGFDNCEVSGDTRFDRVAEIARGFQRIPLIDEFIGNGKCIVAGSTWKGDEEALQKAFIQLNDQIKLIIAPHEIHPAHLKELKILFPGSVFFSELKTDPAQVGTRLKTNVLIIDNIGMLSRLYGHAFITYIGGGFTKDGVHNVLEAAVYGKPVLFGPNYKKYKEAIGLVSSGGGKNFSDKDGLYRLLLTLLNDNNEHSQMARSAKHYVMNNTGATKRILDYIQENRLLTS